MTVTMRASDGFALPDCRNATAYAGTMRLTRLGWAWEFLRRNPTFRKEFSVTLDLAKRVGNSDWMTKIGPAAVSPDWAVLFR